MDSSQGSANIGSRQLKDSIQLSAFRRTESPSGVSHASSHASSITELSYLEERGLRRSFKAIQPQNENPNFELEIDDESGTKQVWTTDETIDANFDREIDEVTEPKIGRSVRWDEAGMKTTSPLQILNSQQLGGGRSVTPSSTGSGSSSTHILWNKKNGGMHSEFNPANMQENQNLATTTRGFLSDRNHPDDGNAQTTHGVNPSVSNGHLETGEWNRPNAQQSEKGGARCLPRCAALVALILAIMCGIVVVIYLAKESQPDSQLGPLVNDPIPEADECDDVSILLGEEIEFSCNFLEEFADVNTLMVIPPPSVNDGHNFNISINAGQEDWKARYSKKKLEMSIKGPETICSSGGQYKFEIIDDDGTSLYSMSAGLTVVSKVETVNMTLLQEASDGNATGNATADADADFVVGCTTRSGCVHAFLDLFSQANQEEQSLKNFEFKCTTSYSESDGYSVGCQGTVPSSILQDGGRISCRPSSALLDDVAPEELRELEAYYELPECDITKNCGFECVEDADFYYAVNTGRCDIFHRCVDGKVYSEFCAPGTFFDPGKCACEHTNTMPAWCQENGAVRKDQIDNISQLWCVAGNQENGDSGG